MILAIEDLGSTVYRFNTEDYPTKVAIDFVPGRPERARLVDRDEAVPLASAKSIWVRRPQWPVISSDLAEGPDRQVAMDESVAALASLWRVFSDKCISPPDAMQSARWKPEQLSRARAIGFSVPESLVTNIPAAAEEFCRSGPAVIKAVGEARAWTPEGISAGGTMTPTGINWEHIKYAPVLCQRRVFGPSELRVTCIDNTCLAVRITPPFDGDVDVRNVNPELCAYEEADVSPSIALQCQTLMMTYGLRFGAFDFKEDANGQAWFLECNPGGQWLWLEAFVNVPITRTLAKALVEMAG